MSVLAVAHPRSSRPHAVRLRSVPDLPPEPPVTVTISIAGGATAGRERVLAALRDLVDVAGPAIEVAIGPAAGLRLDPRARTAFRGGELVELSRLEYDLLLFLASRQAGYITGQSINVDGGMFMS